MSQSGSFNTGTFPPGSAVETLTGNDLIAVGPDGANNIDIFGSGGISVTNTSANTLTISSVAGGFTWIEQTTDTTAVSGIGYFCNGLSKVTLTLPVVSNVGDTFAVYALGSNNAFRVAQNAGQFIQSGFDESAVGATGYLESQFIGDCVTLVCAVANIQWAVVSSFGSAQVFFI